MEDESHLTNALGFSYEKIDRFDRTVGNVDTPFGGTESELPLGATLTLVPLKVVSTREIVLLPVSNVAIAMLQHRSCCARSMASTRSLEDKRAPNIHPVICFWRVFSPVLQ